MNILIDKIVFNGVEFLSLKDLCIWYGVDYNKYCHYLKTMQKMQNEQNLKNILKFIKKDVDKNYKNR